MTEHQKQVLEPVIMAEKNRRLHIVTLAIFLMYLVKMLYSSYNSDREISLNMIIYLESKQKKGDYAMHDFKIKKCTVQDLDEVKKISERTFYETFASENSKEDMEKYLEETFAKDKMKAEIETEG